MPIRTTFKAAMQVLAEMAGPENPPHVRVKAASNMASQLSPLNPRHADVNRALNDVPAAPIPLPEASTGPEEHPYACYVKDAQQSEQSEQSEEDDESEGTRSDDEPP